MKKREKKGYHSLNRYSIQQESILFKWITNITE
jgi:hypothetical protein